MVFMLLSSYSFKLLFHIQRVDWGRSPRYCMVSICLLLHPWNLRFKKSFLPDIYFLRSSKDFFETDSPRAPKRIGSPRFCRQRECFSIVICLNHKTPRQAFGTWGNTARGWGLRVRESSVLVCCSRDRAARDEGRGWLDNPAHCFLQYLFCDIIYSTPQFESYTSSGWKLKVFGSGLVCLHFSVFSHSSIILSWKEDHRSYCRIFKQCLRRPIHFRSLLIWTYV